jgi:hypothetical protein
LRATMITQKKDEEEGAEISRGQRNLSCRLCGRIVRPDECSWEEDDAGMFCPDCQAERQNCGCSD